MLTIVVEYISKYKQLFVLFHWKKKGVDSSGIKHKQKENELPSLKFLHVSRANI